MYQRNYQRILPSVQKLHGSKKVTLLLGTDCHIGEEGIDQETRVCMTPIQTWELKKWLKEAGIGLTLYVIQDAGLRSGYPDQEYLKVGAQIVQEDQLSTLYPSIEVVHALKEPCHYETMIPGLFIRIGALHTGIFDPHGGTACLLRRQKCCAIFDGSAIGNYSFKIDGGFPIPIRSSMSVFAGTIAADTILNNLKTYMRNPTVIIAGGGTVGVSAMNRLLQKKRHNDFEICIIEPQQERCKQLLQCIGNNVWVRVKQSNYVENEDLHNACGLILAPFRPSMPTPKVVDVQSLSEMIEGATVIDVSIDEGGSIANSSKENIKQTIGKLDKTIYYIADAHMPRKYPREASEAHGKAILPYLAVLLYLSAREGGPTKAVEYIKRRHIKQQPTDYFEALVCDLRNGLAFLGSNPVSINGAVVKDEKSVAQFLRSQNILVSSMTDNVVDPFL